MVHCSSYRRRYSVALLCFRNERFNDFAEMATARSQKGDKLRPSTSDPDLFALSHNTDIPCPVKIYQFDESYVSLLITRVSGLVVTQSCSDIKCHSSQVFFKTLAYLFFGKQEKLTPTNILQ